MAPKHTKTPSESMAPALQDWQEQEAKWKREALDWAREKLLAHFETEAGFLPKTVSELMSLLDDDPGMPTAWARICKSDTSSYRERYSNVRNTVEVLARQRVIVLGTTINSKGRDKSTTYARPRDASADWSIQIDGPAEAVRRAKTGIRDWLSLDGSVLDGITGMRWSKLKGKSGGTKSDEQTVGNAGAQGKRRNTRATRGTD